LSETVENVKFLTWPNVRNQVVVQKNHSFSKKCFPKLLIIPFTHTIENGEKEKEEVIRSMLGSNLLLITILYCKLLVAPNVCNDCRWCDRHFADIKTQFSIPGKTWKNVEPYPKGKKYFPTRMNMFQCFLQIWFWCLPYFCVDIMEVVIGFSMLKTIQNTEEDKTCEKEQTCEKRKKHAEKSKRTEKEDRSRKREKGPKLHAAWWLNIKVEINFILFIEKLLEAFFAFQAFLYTLLGGL